MASGMVRNIPTPTAKDGGAFGLSDPGQRVGDIGTKSHFGENVTPIGGATPISQIEAIYKSPFVQRDDNGFTQGDRADFDWVEDNKPLESTKTGASDNHPGASDSLIWEIANIAPSAHLWESPTNPALNIEHKHGNWLTGNEPELTLGRFNSDTFRIIDVVSQIARYADMDVAEADIPATGEMQGKWSPRQSALDYRGGNNPFVEFSKDGNNWQPGKPITVFEDGWTFRSKAEDYVARWLAPFDAKFVRIAAEPISSLHDGNTQIDAIIAGNSRRTVQYMPDPTKPAAGIDPNRGMLASMTFDGGNKLSFGNVVAQLLLLNGGIPSMGDPLEGATFVIGDTSLIGANSEGWEFDDTTLALIMNGTTVLTADVIDSFLFPGSMSHPEFDSHFQGLLSNIFIDNTLNSPYLDDLQAFIDAGGLSFFSFSSDILSATDNFTVAGTSEGIAWGQDAAKTPEPSSIFGLLAFGGLGLIGLRKKH